ncbi:MULTISPECIES: tetratricopeptide repeat protein [unclassified Mesorhizobium]|uniref:tetratricopeptide repeat protein n=1 Tax=unclassified Mesorhizobium TaxID=325217 RepID=UPI0015E2AD5A|nr:MULTISPECIES: tetratricopeptide repeat protein [unclassified Mesorhizobium]
MRRLLLLAVAPLALAAMPHAKAEGAADTAICASSDDSAYSAQQRIAACTALIEGGKNDRSPDFVAALVSRGATYWNVDKMQLALADLSRAIALDPKNARAYRERSNIYRTSGNLDKALADANEAARLDPNDPQAFANRGNVFSNDKQYDRAIADYNQAIRLDAKYAQAWQDRGATYYFKQSYDEAIRNYDEAIRLDPKNARFFTNRGAAYKAMGRTDQAIADESDAIRLDPTKPEYFDNRGLSYEDKKDYDRAIADYNEAIRLRPQANFLTNRANAYNLKGDLDRAITDYDRALALDPNFYLAYHNRAATWQQKGDADSAIADYEQALRIDPKAGSDAEQLANLRQDRDRRQSVRAERLLPTFKCKSANNAVEKAICSDPDLSRIDRRMDDVYKAALAKADRKVARGLREEQRRFIAERNRSFGRPDYNLRRDMERRLAQLVETGAGN